MDLARKQYHRFDFCKAPNFREIHSDFDMLNWNHYYMDAMFLETCFDFDNNNCMVDNFRGIRVVVAVVEVVVVEIEVVVLVVAAGFRIDSVLIHRLFLLVV